MATYTAITGGQLDQDSPINQPLMTALAYNVEAYMETDPSAPFGAYAWQIEDGADGTEPFYVQAVDGSANAVETPTFLPGWEYMILGHGLSVDGAATETNIDIQLYTTNSASYSDAAAIFTTSAVTAQGFSFQAHIKFPMWGRTIHFVESLAASHDTSSGAAFSNHLFFRNTSDSTISKARIKCADPLKSFDAGKMYLLKRAEYGGR